MESFQKFSEILDGICESTKDKHMKKVVGMLREACYKEELGIETNPNCLQMLEGCIKAAESCGLPTDDWVSVRNWYSSYIEES